MNTDTDINYVNEDELYLENFDSRLKKIFNLDSNYDIMTDDTLNAINGLILTKYNPGILDISGLLLDGTFEINDAILHIIKTKTIKNT